MTIQPGEEAFEARWDEGGMAPDMRNKTLADWTPLLQRVADAHLAGRPKA